MSPSDLSERSVAGQELSTWEEAELLKESPSKAFDFPPVDQPAAPPVSERSGELSSILPAGLSDQCFNVSMLRTLKLIES